MNELTSIFQNFIVDTFITFSGLSSYSESLEYVQSWKRFTEITTNRILHPWLGFPLVWKMHPEKKLIDAEIGKVEKFANTLIDRHIHQMNNTPVNVDKAPSKTLISELLNLNYSRKEIRSEVVAMLFAVIRMIKIFI